MNLFRQGDKAGFEFFLAGEKRQARLVSHLFGCSQFEHADIKRLGYAPKPFRASLDPSLRERVDVGALDPGRVGEPVLSPATLPQERRQRLCEIDSHLAT